MERPERGSVWWVDLPHLGRKPSLVVSSNRLNQILEEVVVARITSVDRERALPTAVVIEAGEVDELPARSWILTHSLFTVRRTQLTKPAGDVPEARMAEVEAALAWTLHLRLR